MIEGGRGREKEENWIWNWKLDIELAAKLSGPSVSCRFTFFSSLLICLFPSIFISTIHFQSRTCWNFRPLYFSPSDRSYSWLWLSSDSLTLQFLSLIHFPHFLLTQQKSRVFVLLACRSLKSAYLLVGEVSKNGKGSEWERSKGR